MRHRGLISTKLQITNYKSQIHQRGYMMITLMLALALIMLAMLAVLPDIRQQVRRDREEELRHRGNAYMRAIQHFYKKFGRYPARVEELENTNNVHFLRKRYTDPINIDPVTGKERNFKFLTQQDITLNSGPVLGPTAGQMGSGAQSIFGGSQNGPQTPLGGPQGAFGGQGAQTGAQAATSGAQTSASGDAGSSSSGNSSSGNSKAADNSNSAGSSTSNSNSGSGLNGPTFGGGPILGVASTSKAKSIRVFFKKDHYNDWLFIYLPMADRGGLLNGPVDPGAQTAGLTPGLTPGQMPGGAPGQGGFGSGFGQGSMTNGPTQGPQTPTPPQPPPPTPQQ